MSEMQRLVWNPAETPEDVAEFLRTEAEEFPLAASGDGVKLQFRKIAGDEVEGRMQKTADGYLIEYTALAGAARCIGSALSGFTCSDSTPFSGLGIMLDVSRCMVMKLEHLKQWMRRMALGGGSFLMLYAEDTYELPGEPLFGYMRGRYTAAEIKELDAYAGRLGIEFCGAIQTLAHLQQALKWSVYDEIRDMPEILLVDDERTYALIEKMVKFWSENVRSRRINIGMDEAHGLGLGKFLEKHGYERGFDIINRHLARVAQICEKYGVKPMMWGDMYFRYGSPTGNYYDLDSHVPADVAAKIPGNVDLCYWDYYNTDEAVYKRMFEKHREIGKEPVMASGIWTWAMPWYNHARTIETVIPCLAACRQAKVKTVFFTMWGDDGGYCDYDSAMTGIFCALDHAFGCTDETLTARRFNAICQSDYQSIIDFSKYIYTRVDGNIKNMPVSWINPASILWDDPLLGLVINQHVLNTENWIGKMKDLYVSAKAAIKTVATANLDFEYADALADAVIAKLTLREEVVRAYEAKDKNGLKKVAVEIVPDVIAKIRRFLELFRRQWLRSAKPFCMEVTQNRYAAQMERLNETARRIEEFLAGEAEAIPELDTRLLQPDKDGHLQDVNWYRAIATPYRA